MRSYLGIISVINQIVIISERSNAAKKYKEVVMKKKFHQGIQIDEFEKKVIKGKLCGF